MRAITWLGESRREWQKRSWAHINQKYDSTERVVLSGCEFGELSVIEGPSCSGKTELLYHLCVNALTRRDASMRPQIIYVISSEWDWDDERLCMLLQERIKKNCQKTQTMQKTDVQSLVGTRVIVRRPTTFDELLECVPTVDEFLHQFTQRDASVAYVMLDGLSSFYWDLRLCPGYTKQLAMLQQRLSQLSLALGCPVVCTNWFLGGKPHLRTLRYRSVNLERRTNGHVVAECRASARRCTFTLSESGIMLDDNDA
ncbi:RecA family ATPase Rlp1 [Schizosaccharomyces japonicus yFS275]|uniref:RecA family ATPase Rlp1 n=1 Tax=Schizosaccharomyces japonicus (strain yFS275 / FY16936) TaxID=402676 RepID=B6K273_SCHJY|nr:RecA family ATPase Rlp1 [Schizosaccharomyces japonicus yFS275]EEB07254.1 RecA family ATPase Rlp1 [Schizosaccharomyces japonicus yFS275]